MINQLKISFFGDHRLDFLPIEKFGLAKENSIEQWLVISQASEFLESKNSKTCFHLNFHLNFRTLISPFLRSWYLYYLRSWHQQKASGTKSVSHLEIRFFFTETRIPKVRDFQKTILNDLYRLL